MEGQEVPSHPQAMFEKATMGFQARQEVVDGLEVTVGRVPVVADIAARLVAHLEAKGRPDINL